MRTAEKIFKCYRRQLDGSGYWVNEEDFKTAINEARIETIRECADIAEREINGNYNPLRYEVKQSILTSIEQVK